MRRHQTLIMKMRALLPLVLFCSLLGHAEAVRIDFASRDGTRLSGILNESSDTKALLIVVHGLQSHAGWFQSGDVLAAQGITTLAFDRRGSGMSDGLRGHVDSKEQFLEDLDAAARALKQRHPETVPLHLLANCFGTRVAIPYLARRGYAFTSLILSSPATNMSPAADYNFFEKLAIMVGSDKDYMSTPISDDEFVSHDPWLTWIHNDSLSLREVTKGFLRKTHELDDEMRRTMFRLKTPLLVFLATQDAMVENDKVKEGFYVGYRGPKKLVELESEHYIEFGPAKERYQQELARWILGDPSQSGLAE